MDGERAGADPTRAAVAALGAGPLEEAALQRHVAPLFSRSLAKAGGRIYLANHSLGRPLDAMANDVNEGLAAWYAEAGGAWAPWLAEIEAYRGRIAALLHVGRADSIVPKTSAAQGLRAILNTYDEPVRVVATRGEFDSLDVVLREYARRGRVSLTLVEADAEGRFDTADIVRAVAAGCDLVVVSEVVFNTGQRLDAPDAVVAAAHAQGARVLLDVYHSMGAMPVDLAAADVDFAVGGAYKYLRGGPGACFLYVHPRHLDAGLRTLDIGWFGKRDRFRYERPDPPELGDGGDAFLESTPPVLTYYQARAGQTLALSLGMDRVRAHSQALQRRLVARLAESGIAARGGGNDHGAFVVVRRDDAASLSEQLRDDGVVTDARGPWLRLCPDVLTTDADLDRAAALLARIGRTA